MKKQIVPSGGVIQYPIALVEDEYGVHEVSAYYIRRIE